MKASKLNIQIKYALIATGIIALAILPYNFIFNEDISLCLFNSLSGKECPLCGMTRAGYFLIRLKICAAMLHNPVVLALPVLLISEVLNDFMNYFWLKRIRSRIWLATLLFLVILFAYRLIT